MDLLINTFERLRLAGGKALIPFIMGGDPDCSAVPSQLLALEDAGADVIEVGIPFSDPLADGAVIQAASLRAISAGASPLRVLNAIARAKQRVRTPIVCLSYWNPIVQFRSSTGRGPQGFVRFAHASGCSGLIVPDLPVEELGYLRTAALSERFANILLAAPTSSSQRLRAIAHATEGFVYYVSLTGTTGARRRLPEELRHGIRQVKLLTTKPVCVGFGISTPRQAAFIARIADGVIVGSALIVSMQKAKTRSAARRRAAAFLRRLRRVV